MSIRLISGLACAVSLVFITLPLPTFAQPASAVTAGSAAKADKKQARAQRKAERKAAHAKNKKEVSTLQKNGYDQASDNTNYPANIQAAQKKAAGTSAASAP